MTSTDRVQLVLELIEGRATAAELAARHGVDEQELLAWRDTWVAGARAASRSRAPSRRLWVAGAVVGAALLGLMSKEALAATCAAPASFSSLGLNYFCPNDPALASEFNANTAQLVGLIQQKVGAGFGLPDAGPGTSGITTSSATVAGATTLTGGATIGSTGALNFGTTTRQMLNLWGTGYGVGVQDNTLYFRSGGNFAWYRGGSHATPELNSGGGEVAMQIASDGVLTVSGYKQVNGGGLSALPEDIQRLVVEASPIYVGSAVPINHAKLSQLCRDDDGCEYTLGMVNWDGTGTVASRSGKLFMSQTSNSWRFENDVQGVDGAGGYTDTSAFDCYFGDFDTATDVNNGRVDNGLGFGLLNCRVIPNGGGCNFSDTTTTCRVVIRD